MWSTLTFTSRQNSAAARIVRHTSLILLILAFVSESLAIDKEAFRLRYRESKVALLRSSRIKDMGAVLALKRDGVPARSNRRIDAGIWEININRYASFQVQNRKGTAMPPYDLELARDSLLVITKVEFKRDSIELWTRTIDPYLVSVGYRLLAEELPYYGTKFRFFFPESTLKGDDPSPVYQALEEWFEVFPNFWAASNYLARRRTLGAASR